MSKLPALGLVLAVLVSAERAADPPTEEQAVAALAKLGAQFNVLTGKPGDRPVKGVCFGAKEQVADADLEPLRHLSNLEVVILVDQRRLTGECLRYLAGHQRLHTLDLDGSPVEGKHLAHLKGLSRLWRLGLWRTAVDDAGMAHLKDLPGLQRLYLQETKVGDRGIEALGRHPALRVVDCEGSRVTPTGAAFMKANFPDYGKPADRPPAIRGAGGGPGNAPDPARGIGPGSP